MIRIRSLFIDKIKVFILSFIFGLNFFNKDNRIVSKNPIFEMVQNL